MTQSPEPAVRPAARYPSQPGTAAMEMLIEEGMRQS
jgi:hypothetical protein